MAKIKPETLMKKYHECLKREADNNREKAEIEKLLVGAFGKKDEGSQTHTTDKYKLVITGKKNRTLDQKFFAEYTVEAFQGQEYQLDGVVIKEEKIIYKLSIAGLRRLEKENPEAYCKLARAITTKPGKTTFKLTPLL